MKVPQFGKDWCRKRIDIMQLDRHQHSRSIENCFHPTSFIYIVSLRRFRVNQSHLFINIFCQINNFPTIIFPWKNIYILYWRWLKIHFLQLMAFRVRVIHSLALGLIGMALLLYTSYSQDQTFTFSTHTSLSIHSKYFMLDKFIALRSTQ